MCSLTTLSEPPKSDQPAASRVQHTIELLLRGYLSRALLDHDERELLLNDVVNDVYFDLDEDADIDVILTRAIQALRVHLAAQKRRRRFEVLNTHRVDCLAIDESSAASAAYRLALWHWEDDALSHLSQLQRAALELHEMDGLSDDSIALLLECSLASVRVMRHKAKRTLRNLVANGVLGAPPTE